MRFFFFFVEDGRVRRLSVAASISVASSGASGLASCIGAACRVAIILAGCASICGIEELVGVSVVIQSSSSPDDSSARGTGNLEGHNSCVNCLKNHFEVGIRIDVSDGWSSQTTVIACTRGWVLSRKGDLLENIALVIEDVQVTGASASYGRPGREYHFSKAIISKVNDDWFGGVFTIEVQSFPVVLLDFVHPKDTNLAVEGRVEEFSRLVSIDVGSNGIENQVLDDVVSSWLDVAAKG